MEIAVAVHEGLRLCEKSLDEELRGPFNDAVFEVHRRLSVS
jgi:hypothetical protein